MSIVTKILKNENTDAKTKLSLEENCRRFSLSFYNYSVF